MTMPNPFYTTTIPFLDRALNNLDHVLKKGEANAQEREIEPEVFLTARLAPDMFTLVGQVDVATSLAKACPHRLVGSEPPVYGDLDNRFEALYARIDMARKELAKFSADEIEPTMKREFSVKIGPQERDFIGLSYAHGFTLPNVYFHCTTAYNILRKNGVPIGKLDFFGGGAP